MPPIEQQSQPVIPPQPVIGGEPKKKHTLLWVIIGVFILIALAGGAYFFITMQSAGPKGLTEAAAKKYAPTVIDKIKDIDKWQNGEIWMEGTHGLPESRAVFFKAEKAGFYTVTNVDSALVEKSAQELNVKIDTGKDAKTRSANDITLYTGNEYQIDMLGLMSQIGFAQDPAVIDYLEELLNKAGGATHEPLFVACRDELPGYVAKSNGYLASLTPNYEFDEKYQSYQWHLDTKALKENLSVKTHSPKCYAFLEKYLNSPIEVRGIEDTQLVFEIPKESEDAMTFIAHQAENKSANSSFYKVLKLELTKRNKATLPKTVAANPTSIFTRKSAYALTINNCKTLPVIAGSGTYNTPSMASYKGPHILDGGYYCTEADAQADKYKKAAS
ncbi:MAG TPA: hypothetical protein VFT87_00800 [Candidatus Saccharimonadales bacterium]|nr:hypothetical protein [Candidatus Saccharimonadales bacterium]